MITKLITLYCNISKYFVLKYLATNHILNKKTIYFKNKDLREEILLDENYTPHYTTTYAKAIDIDANSFNIIRNNVVEEKPVHFSIKVKRVNKK